ncbi:hypothetical protein [Herbaspirillum sp. ST 5-3]|uniref:hypothetical protein n=1 Tax=Oxalobacteraceae TaxID=75682 RepID=UPI0010A4F115|nr:hypothetical protein [Herbaspirillum sp. ST 5-3]
MKVLSGITSFLSSFVCVLLVYRWFAKDLFEMLAAVYTTGLVIGIVHGLIFPKWVGQSVFIGALTAVLGLWSPIVIGTYGFAIMGLPLIIIYALCSAFGVQLAAKAISHFGMRSVPLAEKEQTDLDNANGGTVRNGDDHPKQPAGSILLMVFAAFIGWFLSLLYIASEGTGDGWVSTFILKLHPLLGQLAFHIPELFTGICAAASMLLASRVFGANIK